MRTCSGKGATFVCCTTGDKRKYEMRFDVLLPVGAESDTKIDPPSRIPLFQRNFQFVAFEGNVLPLLEDGLLFCKISSCSLGQVCSLPEERVSSICRFEDWKIKQSALIHLHARLTYSSTQKLEAVRFSYMTVNFQQTIRHHISEIKL
jgi:hypothetical protein